MTENPIGVFDSGLGGLTVIRELKRQLPQESVVYFGDNARLPYGTKSAAQIRRFSIENAQFLQKQKIKALVIACNSSSAVAFGLLKRRLPMPVVDVIGPAVREALKRSPKRTIGVIGTCATIESGVYEHRLRTEDPNVRVYTQSCPLFVPLVEEGWLSGAVARRVIEKYLAPLARRKIDTLILGCTHYPLLAPSIQKFLGPGIKLVNSARPTIQELASLLERKKLLYSRKRLGKFQVFTSDLPRNFIQIGERFLGEKLPKIKVIR